MIFFFNFHSNVKILVALLLQMTLESQIKDRCYVERSCHVASSKLDIKCCLPIDAGRPASDACRCVFVYFGAWGGLGEVHTSQSSHLSDLHTRWEL